MSHTLGTQTEPNSFYTGLSEAVTNAWARYWVRRAERATVFVLHSLDERTLKDIGMDRSEIESVVYGQTADSRVRERRAAMCARSNRASHRQPGTSEAVLLIETPGCG